MAVHLVVAYETASSPELAAALRARAVADRDAAFVLLVPATARHHLLAYRRGRELETADKMARSAMNQFESLGLNILKAIAGEADPIAAIAHELGEQEFGSIIICTHPADVSRWLRAQVPRKAQDFGLPVTHVIVRSVAQSLRASEADVSRPPLV